MKSWLLCFTAAGLFLAALCLPFLCEKVPPNRFFGLGLLANFENREVWYRTHRFVARRLIMTFAALMAAAVTLFFLPGQSPLPYSWECLGVLVLGILFTTVKSARHLRSLRRACAPCDEVLRYAKRSSARR